MDQKTYHVMCTRCFLLIGYSLGIIGMIEGEELLTCCFCGSETSVGICVQAPAKGLPCNSLHEKSN